MDLRDLVEEILSKVPATSLTRLRFNCKRWNALLKDQKFITKQMDKAMKQNFVLMLSKFRVYSLSVNLQEIYNNIAFDLFTAQLSPQVKITQAFHCNGLLLCSTKEGNKTKLLVVNPCTGQTRWIEPRSDYNMHDMYALGYENNKSYDSYKILKYSDDCKNFGIFELKSNSWRVLANIPPNMDLCFNEISVSLKGNTYWLSYVKPYISSFDFTKETFRRVRLPVPSQNHYTSLSVVREEKLSVLRWSPGIRQVEIWVSGKTELFWSKSFTFDLDSLIDLPFMSHVSFFIEEEKKVIAVGSGNFKDTMCIVDKHGYKKIYYDTDHSYFCRPFLFSYVPSLVSLYPPI